MSTTISAARRITGMTNGKEVVKETMRLTNVTKHRKRKSFSTRRAPFNSLRDFVCLVEYDAIEE